MLTTRSVRLPRLWKLLGFAAERLLRPSEYSFSADWVSRAVPLWTRCLREFRGRAGVRLLEVGSFEGRSAVWFLANVLTHPTASITCVDVFCSRLAHRRFDHNVKVSGFAHKVTKRVGRSQEVLADLPRESYDIAYIDGSHRAADVRVDASLSWALVRPGGVLIFDDYRWKPEAPPHARPQIAIDDFLDEVSAERELLFKGFQVVVRKGRREEPPHPSGPETRPGALEA
jgi:predicted O-methyltransferase YrrM